MEGEKICSKCKKVLPLTGEYFYYRKDRKSGFYFECKECKKEKNKEYRKINSQKIKEWRENNKEISKKYREKNREKLKKYREENKEKHKTYHLKPQYKFNSYKKNAKKRNLNWDLSFEEFKQFWQQSCIYCGDDIETIGLDRIDNSIGYVKDNIVSCCFHCNFMKKKYSIKDFIEHCEKIVRKYDKSKSTQVIYRCL